MKQIDCVGFGGVGFLEEFSVTTLLHSLGRPSTAA